MRRIKIVDGAVKIASNKGECHLKIKRDSIRLLSNVFKHKFNIQIKKTVKKGGQKTSTIKFNCFRANLVCNLKYLGCFEHFHSTEMELMKVKITTNKTKFKHTAIKSSYKSLVVAIPFDCAKNTMASDNVKKELNAILYCALECDYAC